MKRLVIWKPGGNQVIQIFFGGETLYFSEIKQNNEWMISNHGCTWSNKDWKPLRLLSTINFCATQTRNRIKIEQSRYMMIQHDEASRNTVAQMIKWNCTTETQETTEATDTKCIYSDFI